MLRTPPHRDRWGAFVSAVVLAVLIVIGCERDDTASVDRNRPPETFITEGPENSLDPDDPTDLFYRAHLAWRGEDVDGRVVGFRFAIDDTNDPGAWQFTAQTDSVFRFPVSAVGSREHLFLIRAVDDLGKQDASPDTVRFESYTTATPTVQIVNMVVGDSVFTPTGRDTVLISSTVRWIWTGDDADGDVIAWESKFDNEFDYRYHERNDTTRTEGPLLAGPHVLVVRAIDDAGATSTNVGRFPVWCNFDPKTNVDRASIVATLERPWLGPDSALTVTYNDDGALNDTLPSRSTLSFCWSATDRDGPVQDYFWSYASQGELTAQTCATTNPLLVDDLVGAIPLLVRARDVYGQAETPSDTVYIFINFAPQVEFTVPNPPPVETGVPHRFEFTSTDKDSDPDSLRYEWRFYRTEQNPEPVGPFQGGITMHPDSLAVVRAFTISEVGQYGLQLRARDNGENQDRTIPDIVQFTVVPESGATMQRRISRGDGRGVRP